MRADVEAGMAKLFCSETALEIATECMRIHGGMGYTAELPVERYYRDAPLMIIGEGTSEIQTGGDRTGPAPTGRGRRGRHLMGGFRARLRYRFDNAISRGGPSRSSSGCSGPPSWPSQSGPSSSWCSGPTSARVSDPSFAETYYQTLLRILDPGTFSGDAGWGLRVVTFIVTLFGITVAAVLIGLIATGIEGKVEQLRRGRSPVIESDHTLILGWSPRVFTVVSEIIEADASRSDSAIVVLAPMEKQDMEEALDDRVRAQGRTRLVCRSGDPSSLNDLDRVGIDGARSVIVLADVEAPDGDAYVVKTVARRPDPAR